ncbi:MAG: hypothetical protein M4579_002643 [Chaenotheca gracillima]|nr:MAG: hypothetical protein M4579_002643 [Chaenotheca gracillima]
MSLGVALQSVLYYVVACSACRKVSYRRKRKREAAQAKLEHDALEVGENGLYQHPSPFSTNLYWREEMTLGPGPPQKKGNNRNQRALTAGTSSSMSSSAAVSQGEAASPSEVQLTVDERSSADNWNRRRYQREDEELWGHGRELLHSASEHLHGAARGSSIGVVGLSRTTSRQTVENYYVARNPPVNELHPPVVSTQPTNKRELRWMLQPPPSAHVMSGKERANRSRSDSAGSRRGEDPNLGRRVGERLLEQKRRGGHGNTDIELSDRKDELRSRPPGWSSSSTLTGQSHDRDPRSSADTINSDGSRRKQRPPPIYVSGDPTGQSDQRLRWSEDSFGANGGRPEREVPIRPPLPAILSSSNNISRIKTLPARPTDVSLSRGPSPSRPTNHRAPSSTSSLHLLQKLVPPQSNPNERLAPGELRGPPPPALPPPSPFEEEKLHASLATFSWGYTERDGRAGDNELEKQHGSWSHFEGHSRPTKRWSMDI